MVCAIAVSPGGRYVRVDDVSPRLLLSVAGYSGVSRDRGDNISVSFSQMEEDIRKASGGRILCGVSGGYSADRMDSGSRWRDRLLQPALVRTHWMQSRRSAGMGM